MLSMVSLPHIARAGWLEDIGLGEYSSQYGIIPKECADQKPDCKCTCGIVESECKDPPECTMMISVEKTVGCECTESGASRKYNDQNCSTCGLEQMVELAVNVAKIILGISGSITLLFLIYGGILWVFSGGTTTMVDKGRKTIVAAVIGLAIVFGSWIIINFIIAALTGESYVGEVQLFDRTWYKPF